MKILKLKCRALWDDTTTRQDATLSKVPHSSVGATQNRHYLGASRSLPVSLVMGTSTPGATETKQEVTGPKNRN